PTRPDHPPRLGALDGERAGTAVGRAGQYGRAGDLAAASGGGAARVRSASRAVAKRSSGVGDEERLRRLVRGRDAGGTDVLPARDTRQDSTRPNGVSPAFEGRSTPYRIGIFDSIRIAFWGLRAIPVGTYWSLGTLGTVQRCGHSGLSRRLSRIAFAQAPSRERGGGRPPGTGACERGADAFARSARLAGRHCSGQARDVSRLASKPKALQEEIARSRERPHEPDPHRADRHRPLAVTDNVGGTDGEDPAARARLRSTRVAHHPVKRGQATDLSNPGTLVSGPM